MDLSVSSRSDSGSELLARMPWKCYSDLNTAYQEAQCVCPIPFYDVNFEYLVKVPPVCHFSPNITGSLPFHYKETFSFMLILKNNTQQRVIFLVYLVCSFFLCLPLKYVCSSRLHHWPFAVHYVCILSLWFFPFLWLQPPIISLNTDSLLGSKCTYWTIYGHIH